MNFEFQPEVWIIKVGVNKGVKGFIVSNEDLSSISIIIAFSEKRVYGLFAFDSTTDSETIKYFISKIYQARSEGFNENNANAVLVCDNAKYHKSIATKTFIESCGVRLLTITPYWPWLNPAELIISHIKQKLKKEIVQGR